MRDDERFMTRALDLARSAPHTSPNPKVGAVVVHRGRIIGEGVHRGPGSPHAETLALACGGAEGATLYVNLEPCNHTGRMPPCVPRIVQAGIKRVVAAIVDPDPRVNGRGFDALRDAGAEVAVGTSAVEARRLNAPYLHHRATGRPHLTLKMAMTLDGALAAPDGSARWITSARTRALVHRWRLAADAVLVGAGTVAADNPRLTVRAVPSDRHPLRVIVDSSGRAAPSAYAFAVPGRTLVATLEGIDGDIARAWSNAGAEVMRFPRGPGGVDLKALLAALGERGCTSVLCEGGARLAASLLREDLVDSVRLHYGPKFVGRGGLQLGDLGVRAMHEALEWVPYESEILGGDVLVSFERRAR